MSGDGQELVGVHVRDAEMLRRWSGRSVLGGYGDEETTGDRIERVRHHEVGGHKGPSIKLKLNFLCGIKSFTPPTILHKQLHPYPPS